MTGAQSVNILAFMQVLFARGVRISACIDGPVSWNSARARECTSDFPTVMAKWSQANGQAQLIVASVCVDIVHKIITRSISTMIIKG